MPYPFTPADIPSQTGRRILITGGNSGIGYATALALARHGATLLLACRDHTRGQAAIRKLAGQAPQAPPAQLIELNLASFASIRKTAATLLAQNLPLDILINNAGVFAPPQRRETEDGFELQWGTNVLGHFALTCLLLPLLKQAPKARIVTVASIAHKRGKLNFDDLQSTRRYAPQGAYQQSKLGDLMFAFALERHLTARSLDIVSIAVHPGVAQTGLFKIGNSEGLARTLERVISSSVGLFFNDDAGGALPTLYAATSPAAEGGAYYGSQNLFEMRGGNVGPAKIAPRALDQAAQQRLWQHCEQATACTL